MYCEKSCKQPNVLSLFPITPDVYILQSSLLTCLNCLVTLWIWGQWFCSSAFLSLAALLILNKAVERRTRKLSFWIIFYRYWGFSNQTVHLFVVEFSPTPPHHVLSKAFLLLKTAWMIPRKERIIGTNTSRLFLPLPPPVYYLPIKSPKNFTKS